MDAFDLLAYRTPLVGAVVAAMVGVAGGLVMRTGPQIALETATYPVATAPRDLAEPIAWPAGKVPDYVIGTDFLTPPQDPAPEVVASEPLPDEDLVVEPEAAAEQLVEVEAPPAPEPPPAPVAVAALH